MGVGASAQRPGGRRGEGNVSMLIALLCCLCILTVLGIFGVIGFGGWIAGRDHEHKDVYGVLRIDNVTGPRNVTFNENTTCIEIKKFVEGKKQGTMLGAADGYIKVLEGGTYMYTVKLTASFGEHLFPFTPWEVYVGLNHVKQAKEGKGVDVGWHADDGGFPLFEWPFLPHNPADMDLSGLMELESGDLVSMFLGFPPFHLNIANKKIEQTVHAGGLIDIVGAKITLHKISGSTPV